PMAPLSRNELRELPPSASLRPYKLFTIAAAVKQIAAAEAAVLTGDRRSTLLQSDEVAVGFIAGRIHGAPLVGIDGRRMDDGSSDQNKQHRGYESHEIPPLCRSTTKAATEQNVSYARTIATPRMTDEGFRLFNEPDQLRRRRQLAFLS